MATINQTEMMKLAFGLRDRGIEFSTKSFCVILIFTGVGVGS